MGGGHCGRAKIISDLYAFYARKTGRFSMGVSGGGGGGGGGMSWGREYLEGDFLLPGLFSGGVACLQLSTRSGRARPRFRVQGVNGKKKKAIDQEI